MAQAAPPPHPRRDPALTPVDCVACGACCWSDDPTYISVHEVDWARLAPEARALVEVIDGRRYLRRAGGRCAALDIRLEEGDPRYLCRIYEDRPDACRWLLAGGGECGSQRDEKRPRALLAAESLVRQSQ